MSEMSEERVVTRADVVREARALLGTPFRHQGRDPASGLDCLGLLEYLAFRLWGRVMPPRQYRRRPDGAELLAGLQAELREIPVAGARAGDAVLIVLPRHDVARHVGLLSDGPYELEMIHAFETDTPGSVIAEPYRGWKRKLTVRAFRFPGIVD